MFLLARNVGLMPTIPRQTPAVSSFNKTRFLHSSILNILSCVRGSVTNNGVLDWMMDLLTPSFTITFK
jgi:hypothetical protein